MKHERPVAVKVFHLDFADAMGRERFLREMEIVAHLRYPNILPLHDPRYAALLQKMDSDQDVLITKS
jgi:serine/threonine protein kinase